MEQCLAYKTHDCNSDVTSNMAPHILYSKESTHTAYKQDHRYILHHEITYNSQMNKTVLQYISGKLNLIDDMGYQIPCSFIPITILSSDNGSFKTSLTDLDGNYFFSYEIDYTSTALFKKVRYTSNLKLFAYLPTVRIHFPFDTIIDDWDNILVETPYLLK